MTLELSLATTGDGRMNVVMVELCGPGPSECGRGRVVPYPCHGNPSQIIHDRDYADSMASLFMPMSAQTHNPFPTHQ